MKIQQMGGGMFINEVEKNPRVVLFDEIEKAHEMYFNMLLQVMDYGNATGLQMVKKQIVEILF